MEFLIEADIFYQEKDIVITRLSDMRDNMQVNILAR